jgi:hypothetical protein
VALGGLTGDGSVTGGGGLTGDGSVTGGGGLTGGGGEHLLRHGRPQDLASRVQDAGRRGVDVAEGGESF